MEREISKLKANPQNPRGAVERDAAFRDLAASIKSQGILQPILITPSGLIVAGHRRVAAAEEAGLKTVPVVVREMSRIEQLQAMLAENLLRADLNVLQEGAAYNLLVEYGLKTSEIAKAVGVAGTRVADCIAVLSLHVDVQRQFAWGVLPLSCARVLARVTPAQKQIEWADRAVKDKLNGPALDNAINAGAARSASSHARGGATANGSNPRFLREMIDHLENMEEQLNAFPDFRTVQSLLRQATNQMIEKLQKMRRTKAA